MNKVSLKIDDNDDKDEFSFPLVPHRIRSVLRKSFGIKRLYNFQAKIQTYLIQSWTAPLYGSLQASDLKVYVPTGYGKTLSYVIPILTYVLEHPQGRKDKGVKGLIIVPSRELAIQTFQTFIPFIKKLHKSKEISVCCLSGRLLVELEENLLNGSIFSELTQSTDSTDSTTTTPPDSTTTPTTASISTTILKDHIGSEHDLRGPDILICVASRLAAHVGPYSSSGLDSCDFGPLRYVVIDEADLLLSQSWHAIIDWESALQRLTVEKDSERLLLSSGGGNSIVGVGSAARGIPSSLLALGGVSLLSSCLEDYRRGRDDFIRITSGLGSSYDTVEDYLLSNLDKLNRPISLHKLIFTATDISDYRGIQDLCLNKPITIRGSLDDNIQRNLRQWTYEITSERSSLRKSVIKLIKYFLVRDNDSKILIFCSSTNTVEKYKDLLSNSFDDKVACLSSTQSSNHRLRALQEFKTGQKSILVSTDLGCRGLDIDNVTAVIQVGLPRSPEVYIHRIGRTARTGRNGDAVLVYKKEHSTRHYFNDLIHKANKFRICDLHPINGIVDNKINI